VFKEQEAESGYGRRVQWKTNVRWETSTFALPVGTIEPYSEGEKSGIAGPGSRLREHYGGKQEREGGKRLDPRLSILYPG